MERERAGAGVGSRRRGGRHGADRRRRVSARDQHLRVHRGDLRRFRDARRLAGPDARAGDVRRGGGPEPGAGGLHPGGPGRSPRSRSPAVGLGGTLGPRRPGRLRTHRRRDRGGPRAPRPLRRGLSRSPRRHGRRTRRGRRGGDSGAGPPRRRPRPSRGRHPGPSRQRHGAHGGAGVRHVDLPHLSPCRHGDDGRALLPAADAASGRRDAAQGVRPLALPGSARRAMDRRAAQPRILRPRGEPGAGRDREQRSGAGLPAGRRPRMRPGGAGLRPRPRTGAPGRPADRGRLRRRRGGVRERPAPPRRGGAAGHGGAARADGAGRRPGQSGRGRPVRHDGRAGGPRARPRPGRGARPAVGPPRSPAKPMRWARARRSTRRWAANRAGPDRRRSAPGS